MKRLQYWTEVDPEYTQEAADAIERLDADTFWPTEEEMAQERAEYERKRAAYDAMSADEFEAMVDAWSEEAGLRYDARGGRW